MSQFSIGEIAILRNDPTLTPDYLTWTSGEEVEIIELPRLYATDTGFQLAYLVKHGSGLPLIAAPHELRRRKPPTTGEQSILALFVGTPQREKEPA